MLLEGKLLVEEQDKASKDIFFLTPLLFQSDVGLKMSHKKRHKERGAGGGVRKVQKKCHVLFEWSLKTALSIQAL
jgi:hypothetical protein